MSGLGPARAGTAGRWNAPLVGERQAGRTSSQFGQPVRVEHVSAIDPFTRRDPELGAVVHERQTTRDAVARFEAAGLSLPDLTVEISDDDAPCHGHLGLFRAGGDSLEMTICSDLGFVYAHELAHAWITVNVTETQRREE